MADELDEERNVEEEYKWILREEVSTVLKDLQKVILECCRRFPIPVTSNEDNLVRPDKLILTTTNGGQQSLKCMVTLMGDSVCEADLTVKLQKTPAQIHKTNIHHDMPWKLQQIQDSGNHLCHALSYIRSRSEKMEFRTGEEVTMLLDNIIDCLNKGRTCLVLPKRKSLDDLINNKSMRCFRPPLPVDCGISFYVHAQKLVLAMYQFQITPAKTEIISRQQLEVFVPWLNEVIVLYSLALQMCQQLKDKLSTIEQCRASSIYKNLKDLPETEV